MEQRSIGREAAIALAESHWWDGKSAREIAEFQMFTKELSCPFDVFHKAVEEALNRPVWTHEFGLDLEGLCKELMGERPAPTMQEILDLIPEDKRIVVMTKDKRIVVMTKD